MNKKENDCNEDDDGGELNRRRYNRSGKAEKDAKDEYYCNTDTEGLMTMLRNLRLLTFIN